jgi:hypothetical protein
MGTTNEASFRWGNQSWYPPSTLTLVFDGIIPNAQGDVWIRIPLTTPFAYDGTENLVIAVDENNPDFDGENDKFYYSNVPITEGYRSLSFYDDDFNPDPNSGKPSGVLLNSYANIQIEGLSQKCKLPLTPTISDITGISARANWSAPTLGPAPTTYTWKVVPSGKSVDTVAVSQGTTSSLTALVTGLVSGRNYDFYVRTTCATQNVVRWTKPITFTSGCPSITNFPMVENFEATTAQNLPECWTEIDSVQYGEHWHTETGVGKSGGKGAVLAVKYQDKSYLILPQVTLNGNQRLRYSTRISALRNDIVKYAIKLSTTGKRFSNFNTAVTDTMSVSHTMYRDTTHSLEAYSGNIYLAIEVPDNLTRYNNTFYVDDIIVEDIPSCVEPTSLLSPLVTADTAVLKWARNGNDNAKWQICYGDSASLIVPSGIVTANAKTVIADSNVFILRNLTQFKNYVWWVRSICSAGDTSRWSNSAYFNTPAACGQPTNITFATDSTTTRFHWTTNRRPVYWEVYYGIADTTIAPTSYLNLNGTTQYVPDTTIILTNLKYPKVYSVWVKSLCDTSVGNSQWSEKAKLQTYEKNDFCSNAIPINIDSNYATALTHPTPVSIGAEGLVENYTEYYLPFLKPEGNRNDVWYKFVTPTNGKRVVIRTTSIDENNRWVMGLYDSCGAVSATRFDFNNLNNGYSSINLCPYQYKANTTYYVRLFPYSLAGQPLTNSLVIYTDEIVCPNIPVNDNCKNAIRFTQGETVAGSNYLATADTSARPICVTANEQMYDVWYKFSSGSGANRLLNAEVVLENTSEKFFNTMVYKGSCSALKEFMPDYGHGCNFTTSNIESSTFDVMGLEENSDYYVRVWSTSTLGTGNFGLHLGRVNKRDSAFVNFESNWYCDYRRTIKIDSTNNNRWVPIMGYKDIIAEIKAEGQNLGDVKTSFYAYFDTVRTLNGQPYLNRNIKLTASNPPTAPIKMRFYAAEMEWDSLKMADGTVNDTNFRLIRMVGDTSCKMDVDPTGFTVTRMSDAKLTRLFPGAYDRRDYCFEYTTSSLGHFFVTGIASTSIAYPATHLCPSAAVQLVTQTGARGGTYSATPAGLSISPTTGTITPATSSSGLYTITYTSLDVEGGRTTTTTMRVDAATQIINQPVARKVLTVGTQIHFTVGAVGINLTYQWYKNNSVLTGATLPDLIIAGLSGDTGIFKVVVTGDCGSVTSQEAVVSTFNGVVVSAKVILQGAFNTATGLMNDNLRAQGYLPITEPYTGLSNFTHVKGNSGATLTPSVLPVTGPTAVVDWVFLELRSASNPSVIVATQSALVRRDGVIIDVEGNTSIYFGDIPEANYYMAVRHRNHFGVRTLNTLAFVRGTTTSFDFSGEFAPIYINLAIQTNLATTIVRSASGTNYQSLWAGDINRDGVIKYTGSGNDRAILLTRLNNSLNGTASGYLSEDINLSGTVIYSGTQNDRFILLNSVNNVLTDVLNQHL